MIEAKSIIAIIRDVCIIILIGTLLYQVLLGDGIKISISDTVWVDGSIDTYVDGSIDANVDGSIYADVDGSIDAWMY